MNGREVNITFKVSVRVYLSSQFKVNNVPGTCYLVNRQSNYPNVRKFPITAASCIFSYLDISINLN